MLSRKWLAVVVSVVLSVGLFGIIVQADTGPAPAKGAPAAQEFSVMIQGFKQGKIKGSLHDESIRVEHFSHEISSSREAGSGLATGRRQHSPLIIRKPIDKATPLLYRSTVTNENLTSVKLQVSAASKPIYIITLTNATIASMSQGVDANGQAFEEISFTYQKIEWTWTDGGVTAQDEWDVQR